MGGVYTAGDELLVSAPGTQLLADNKPVSSVFSQRFLLFLPPKFLLISYHPIDCYSDICYLGCFLSMNDLSQSSFFDLSINLSIEWQFQFSLRNI